VVVFSVPCGEDEGVLWGAFVAHGLERHGGMGRSKTLVRRKMEFSAAKSN